MYKLREFYQQKMGSKCYHMEHDFEDIEVKGNAIELLESTLRRKRQKCMIGTGSMTDPYIPLEMEIGNVRKAIGMDLYIITNRYFSIFKHLSKSNSPSN